MQDITNAIDFIKAYWWQLALGTLLIITLAKIIIEQTLRGLLKLILMVIQMPFKLISMYPLFSFIVVLILGIWWALK